MPALPQDIGPELEAVRAEYQLPALAAVVLRRGRIIAQGAAGVRKEGDPTPVEVTDPFHMGSCTKAMTATLCGVLVEQNKLRWEATLGEILGSVVPQMQPDWKPVTLSLLLTHRSGLTVRCSPKNSDPNVVWRLPGSPRQIREQFARMMLAERPETKAGTEFIYSNVNYALAGLMAETVTSTPWETLMQQVIFTPLDMKSAGFGPMGSYAAPGTRNPPVDAPWQHIYQNGKNVPIIPNPNADSPQTIAPSGVVHCSLQDWAAFVYDHMRGERGQSTILLKPETYRVLHTPPAGADYAAGWMLIDRAWGGGRVWNHSGSNGRNFCVVWASPKRDFAVLVATNTGAPQAAKACDKATTPLISRALAST